MQRQTQNGPGDPHNDELNKYGGVVGGGSFGAGGYTLAGGVIPSGATAEFGYVLTSKNWMQLYYTIHYSASQHVAASIRGTTFALFNKGNNVTTFSDWAGSVTSVSVALGSIFSIQGNMSTTYYTVGITAATALTVKIS